MMFPEASVAFWSQTLSVPMVASDESQSSATVPVLSAELRARKIS